MNRKIRKQILDILPAMRKYFIGREFSFRHVFGLEMHIVKFTILNLKYVVKPKWRANSGTHGDDELEFTVVITLDHGKELSRKAQERIIGSQDTFSKMYNEIDVPLKMFTIPPVNVLIGI